MQLGLSLALTQTRNIGVASAPSRFSSSWWTLTDAGTGGTLTVTINSLPYNGGSAITDIEYQVDGAGWVSSGLTGIGTFNITGLSTASHFVALRAVNALGKAAADYSFGGSTPQFVIDDAAQYYLSQTGKTAASARTVTMTDPVTVRDADGLWKHSCHNLLSYPSEFDNAAWAKINGGTGVVPVITANYGVAPDGSMTADRMVLDIGSGALSADYSAIQQIEATTTQTGGGIWIKTVDNSTKTIGVRIGSETPAAQTIDGTWALLAGADQATANYLQIIIRGNYGTSKSVDVLIWGAHLYPSNLGGMQANPDTDTSFVGGTGTGPFFARPVEYALDGSASMPIAPGATNLVPDSNDFTTWGKVNTTITAAASTGPDGNSSMSKIVEDTTASVEHYVEDGLANGAGDYIQTYRVKAGDTPNFWLMAVHVGETTTTSSIQFTISSGVITPASTSNNRITNATAVALGNGIYECTIYYTLTSATTSHRIRFYPRQVSVYTGDGTSGTYICFAQAEAGSFPTPYIPTNGAVTSRAAIQASTAKAMIGTDASLTKGTWVMGFDGAGDKSSNYRYLWAIGPGYPLYSVISSGFVQTHNGTTALAGPIGTDITTAVDHRIAISFEDGVGRSVTSDGNAASTDSNNYLTTNPPTDFWWMQTSTQTNMPGGSMIRGVMFPDRLSDADLASITDAATIWPSWGEKSATPT